MLQIAPQSKSLTILGPATKKPHATQSISVAARGRAVTCSHVPQMVSSRTKACQTKFERSASGVQAKTHRRIGCQNLRHRSTKAPFSWVQTCSGCQQVGGSKTRRPTSARLPQRGVNLGAFATGAGGPSNQSIESRQTTKLQVVGPRTDWSPKRLARSSVVPTPHGFHDFHAFQEIRCSTTDCRTPSG